MGPSYDFDIHWLIPRDLEADPAIGKLLGDIGFNTSARGNYVALFRDPDVVEMIDRADPAFRDFLKSSGFGFIRGGSKVPAGYYPAEDDAARTDVIARLEGNLDAHALRGADLGGFDFGQFLKSVIEARALPTDAPDPAPSNRPDRLPVDDAFAAPSGYARLTGRNRVLPLMVLSLAATLGLYWAVHYIEMMPASF